MKKILLLAAAGIVFLATAADKTKTITLSVSGMTCQSCATTVEKALKKVNGVKAATVDLKNNKATVQYAGGKITAAALIQAVSDAGFDASTDAKPAKPAGKNQMKATDEECGDDCCGDKEEHHAPTDKTKKMK